jgi:hypothetical protein
MLPRTCSPTAAAARSTAASSSRYLAAVQAREAGQGGQGLAVDPAVAVVVEAELDL